MTLELTWSTKQSVLDKIETLVFNDNSSQDDIILEESNIRVLQGDNLDLMLSLPQSYYDIAYLDPPYNTKNKFKTYSDDFAQKVYEYKKNTRHSSKKQSF